MSMGTRNQLLAAWVACQRFQRGSLRVEKLVNAFYQARRKLREDIQIYDAEKPLTEKDVDNALQQPF
jgi:hypothetical protein